MTSELVLLLQGGALVWFLCITIVRVLLSLPAAVLHSLWGSLQHSPQQQGSHSSAGCVFYEGTVSHVRARPVYNAFQCASTNRPGASPALHMLASLLTAACSYLRRYPVRMAVIDLDRPPAWWPEQAGDHMTAAAARQFAGTDGACSSQQVAT